MAKPQARDKLLAKIEKRIMPVKEAEPYVKILVYGRNKQGKTRFAATAPNVLIVDINEKGTRSVRNYPGAKVFHVRAWEDLTHVYWFLREGNHNFESVVIDTITNMQHLCMKHVLGEAEDRDPNREPNMPDRRAWGKLSELMKPLLYNFRNLPMHVVFVAQERVLAEEDEGIQERVPDLSPGTRGVAMGSVDLIGRIYQKEVRVVKGKKESSKWETRMLVGPHDEYATGGRTISLGRIIRNPSVPQIIEAMNEED